MERPRLKGQILTNHKWKFRFISLLLFPLSLTSGLINGKPLNSGLLAVDAKYYVSVSPGSPPEPRILPNPEGYSPPRDLIKAPKMDESTSSIVWDLIDALPVENPEALKIINKGEGGESNSCNWDSSGYSCGSFQFRLSTFLQWSKESKLGFKADDLNEYIPQIILADWALSRGYLCHWGTSWEKNPPTLFHEEEIIKPLKSIFGDYHCTKTSDIFYPRG